MITLYSGTPGSGKSLHLARRIYNTLRYCKDKLIVSNIDIRTDLISKTARDRFIYLPNSQITKSRLEQIVNEDCERRGKRAIKEGQYLLILDEAQLLFNARSWQANDNKGWIEFFTQHRKWGYDVVMVAQTDRMIDRQIRSLIEYNVIHRKISRFGIKGIILGFLIGNFVAISCWYGINEVVERDFFRYSRKLGRLYDTFQVWQKASA